MDIIIPSHYRPQRLVTTLTSLYLQKLPGDNRLILAANGDQDVRSVPQVQKLLAAFRRKGFVVEQTYCEEKTISKIKRKALEMANQPIVALLDNDILLTRHDTLRALEQVLHNYDVACVSPIGFELDDDRPVLNEYSHLYETIHFDAQGVGEGTIALGFLLVMNRKDVQRNMMYWCDDLPYMEDQILVHFLKKNRGYAYLNHPVYHMAYKEAPSYEFDEDAVVRYLQTKGPEFNDILELRMLRKDGAAFEKPIQRKDNG